MLAGFTLRLYLILVHMNVAFRYCSFTFHSKMHENVPVIEKNELSSLKTNSDKHTDTQTGAERSIN